MMSLRFELLRQRFLGGLRGSVPGSEEVWLLVTMLLRRGLGLR